MNRCPYTLDMFSSEADPPAPLAPARRRQHAPSVSQQALRLYLTRGDIATTAAEERSADAAVRLPETAPYQSHSPTSAAAARAIAPRLSGMRLTMLQELRRLPCMRPGADQVGMTDNQLIAHFQALGWNANTPRARRVDLVRAGCLVQVGVHKRSALWALTAYGMEAAEG